MCRAAPSPGRRVRGDPMVSRVLRRPRSGCGAAEGPRAPGTPPGACAAAAFGGGPRGSGEGRVVPRRPPPFGTPGQGPTGPCPRGVCAYGRAGGCVCPRCAYRRGAVGVLPHGRPHVPFPVTRRGPGSCRLRRFCADRPPRAHAIAQASAGGYTAGTGALTGHGGGGGALCLGAVDCLRPRQGRSAPPSCALRGGCGGRWSGPRCRKGGRRGASLRGPGRRPPA